MGNELLDLIKRHRALFAGFDDTAAYLRRVERLAALILLDDEHRQHLDLFIGRKALLAALTLSPAANRAVLSRTGIDDAALGAAAIYAFHLYFLL